MLPGPQVSIKMEDDPQEETHEKKNQIFTRAEVAKHNTREDCYTIVHGKVYDVTNYMLEHPGGFNLVFKNAGKDCTSDFEGMFHSQKARAILEKYRIGSLKDTGITSSRKNLLTRFANSNNIPMDPTMGMMPPRGKGSGPYGLGPYKPNNNSNNRFGNKSILPMPRSRSKGLPPRNPRAQVIHKTEYKAFELAAVQQVCSHTKLFKFRLPSSSSKLPLKPGEHIQVKGFTEDDPNTPVERKYTPIHLRDGYFDLLIKKYQNGPVSSFFHRLKPGDKIQARGPHGLWQYSPNKYDNIIMLAAGTGITPMFQILESAFSTNSSSTDSLIKLQTPESDFTKFSLLYSSRSFILLYQELEKMKLKHADRLSIRHLVTKPIPEAFCPPDAIVNRLSLSQLEELNVFELLEKKKVKILICGPDSYVDFAALLLKDFMDSVYIF
mmetsp:Transcript_7421/g.10961  ORF Transcript_7421/g.10961 Transcript_7421/m.10961 type:complete len:437 (-) Transcript_7421:1458-2768(-)